MTLRHFIYKPKVTHICSNIICIRKIAAKYTSKIIHSKNYKYKNITITKGTKQNNMYSKMTYRKNDDGLNDAMKL